MLALCAWMIAAPASPDATASTSTSSALLGMFGFRYFGAVPLMAASMMTAVSDMA
jgi:uncharacterized membrane protein